MWGVWRGWQDTESSQEIFLFRNTFGTRHYPIGKPEHLKQKSTQKFGKTQKVVRIVQEIFLFRNTFGTRHYPIGKPERLKEKSAESYL